MVKVDKQKSNNCNWAKALGQPWKNTTEGREGPIGEDRPIPHLHLEIVFIAIKAIWIKLYGGGGHPVVSTRCSVLILSNSYIVN